MNNHLLPNTCNKIRTAAILFGIAAVLNIISNNELVDDHFLYILSVLVG